MLPTQLLLGSKDNQLLVIHRGKHTYCSCRWSWKAYQTRTQPSGTSWLGS